MNMMLVIHPITNPVFDDKHVLSTSLRFIAAMASSMVASGGTAT